MMKPMTLALLLIGSAVILVPTSVHASETCDGRVYDPTNGDALVLYCREFNYEPGCYSYEYWYETSTGQKVPYYTSHNCNGQSWNCYVNTVYYDSNPVRVGVC